MEQEFKSVAELDKVYSDHLDSLLAGGFIVLDTPEWKSYMGTWAEAVQNLKDELAKPRNFSQL